MPGTFPVGIINQYRIFLIFFPLAQQGFGPCHSRLIITIFITTARSRIYSIKIPVFSEHTYSLYQSFFPRSIVHNQSMHFSDQLFAVFRHFLSPDGCRTPHTVSVFFPQQIQLPVFITYRKRIYRTRFLCNQRTQILIRTFRRTCHSYGTRQSIRRFVPGSIIYIHLVLSLIIRQLRSPKIIQCPLRCPFGKYITYQFPVIQVLRFKNRK